MRVFLILGRIGVNCLAEFWVIISRTRFYLIRRNYKDKSAKLIKFIKDKLLSQRSKLPCENLSKHHAMVRQQQSIVNLKIQA